MSHAFSPCGTPFPCNKCVSSCAMVVLPTFCCSAMWLFQLRAVPAKRIPLRIKPHVIGRSCSSGNSEYTCNMRSLNWALKRASAKLVKRINYGALPQMPDPFSYILPSLLNLAIWARASSSLNLPVLTSSEIRFFSSMLPLRS